MINYYLWIITKKNQQEGSGFITLSNTIALIVDGVM